MNFIMKLKISVKLALGADATDVVVRYDPEGDHVTARYTVNGCTEWYDPDFVEPWYGSDEDMVQSALFGMRERPFELTHMVMFHDMLVCKLAERGLPLELIGR